MVNAEIHEIQHKVRNRQNLQITTV